MNTQNVSLIINTAPAIKAIEALNRALNELTVTFAEADEVVKPAAVEPVIKERVVFYPNENGGCYVVERFQVGSWRLATQAEIDAAKVEVR